jgi:hypothetical protein
MTNVLMEKEGERMFVPPEKVPSFLEVGWKIVNEPPSIVSGQPSAGSDQSSVSSEAPEETEPAKGKPGKKKS